MSFQPYTKSAKSSGGIDMETFKRNINLLLREQRKNNNANKIEAIEKKCKETSENLNEVNNTLELLENIVLNVGKKVHEK